MKIHVALLAFFTLLLTFMLSAADKLAVAEPVGSQGMTEQELNVFWGMLEANAGGGEYELISRSALKSMLTEVGLTEKSALIDPSEADTAKLGKIKGVNCILVSKIGRFGSRISVTLMVLNVTTGVIKPDQRISETVNSMDELSDKIKNILRRIGIGPAVTAYGKTAILYPLCPAGTPDYFYDEAGSQLENALIENGIKVQNLKSVQAILRKNKIGSLTEAEPAMYARIGDLLQVDYLVQIVVTRFSVRTEKKYVEVSRTTSTRTLGDINGTVRVLSAQTGELVKSAPFRAKVDFDTLDDDTTDWEAGDYGRYLIDSAMPAVGKFVVSALKK